MTRNEKQKYLVCKVHDLEEQKRKVVNLKNMEIGIFYVDGQYYAWRNICPHAAAPICEGVVCGTKLPSLVYEYTYGKDQEIIRCPWHGWEFDLKTGRHLADEKVGLRGFDVIVEGDDIYLVI